MNTVSKLVIILNIYTLLNCNWLILGCCVRSNLVLILMGCPRLVVIHKNKQLLSKKYFDITCIRFLNCIERFLYSIEKWRKKFVRSLACGVLIQRTFIGKLVLCSQKFDRTHLSHEKAQKPLKFNHFWKLVKFQRFLSFFLR